MLAFFARLAALGLVFMADDLTIVGGWIYRFLPGFNKLRDSGRALLLLGMGMAGLAGYGLDALVAALESSTAPRRSLMWWLVGLTTFIVVAAFGVMPVFFKDALAVAGE